MSMFEAVDSGTRPAAGRSRPTNGWPRAYRSRLIALDSAIVLLSVFLTQLAVARPGVVATGDPTDRLPGLLLLSAIWLGALAASGSWDPRFMGVGVTEYRQVATATFAVIGATAAVALLVDADGSTSYIFVTLPLGLLALLAGRWAWRRWLAAHRAAGEFASRVVLVGSRDTVIAIASELRRRPEAGYRVVAACITGTHVAEGDDLGVPVFTTLDGIPELLEAFDADTVMITGGDLTPRRIRELSWSLEPGRRHLVVAPSLTDVGGPRIHLRPIAGLPLVHVETPRYTGFKNFLKRAFDLITASLAIVLLSPVLVTVVIVVKLDSPGEVLFRQPRVGHGGRLFTMLKFRTMVADAEQRLEGVLGSQGAEGNSVMFKMRNDPRVTSAGRFLRRYSLDELPQLFNVLAGEMSLVGPRPPLEREVAAYERHVHRRFLVKPGITGLWQVSGRSNLSWEETVRLDLFYVENWSLLGDTAIIWRTARSVLRRDGAY